MKVFVVERPGRPLSVRTTKPRPRKGWVIREAVIRDKALQQIVDAAIKAWRCTGWRAAA